MLETLGGHILDAFLEDIEEGPYALESAQADIARIRDLVRRYDDLSLGFSDAAVVACAERNGGRVLTVDVRHFRVVQREGRIRVIP
ncbi:MAG TPA: DNA-binding protein [Chloroflexota bacterium]|nr:DNA-binding protein [Chloroflexota bacterium]